MELPVQWSHRPRKSEPNFFWVELRSNGGRDAGFTPWRHAYCPDSAYGQTYEARKSSRGPRGQSQLTGRVLLDPYETEIQRRMDRVYGLGKGLPTIDLLDVVPDLDETVHPHCFMNGSSRTVDLAFLKALARKFPHCRYLEIGTLRGERIAMLRRRGGMRTSEPFQRKDDAERVERQFFEEHRPFSPAIPNLTRMATTPAPSTSLRWASSTWFL